jgi:hypothetical protein
LSPSKQNKTKQKQKQKQKQANRTATASMDEEWKVTVKDIENCSFGSWYEEMKDVTFKSKVFRFPQDHPFVKYLHADGVFVHRNRSILSSSI